jgi:dual specificity MAP kinase phosphatase
MHLEHVTAHPPDSVLFPFLHGLEGDNEAQSMFFVPPTDKALALQSSTGMLQDQLGRIVRPPRYRGLAWVLCDDDLEDGVDGWMHDGEYDTDSDEFSSEDGEAKGDDVEMNSGNGDPHPRDLDAMDVDSAHDLGPDHTHPPSSHENYMHPLALRISTPDHDTNTKTSVPFPSAPLNVAFTTAAISAKTKSQSQGHDRRHSNASSTESSSTYDSSSASNSSSGSTSVTSLPSPSSPSCPGGIFDSFDSPDSATVFQNGTATTTKQARSRPPILTCSFLPSQLIQPCTPPRAYDFNGWKVDVYGEDIGGVDLDWELKPAKVPEGISLRNFGIQVVSNFPKFRCLLAFLLFFYSSRTFYRDHPPHPFDLDA